MLPSTAAVLDAQSSPQTSLLLSIDTEEDHWQPRRTDVQVTNVRQLPSFHDFVTRLGIRPTYFVTYQVANADWAANSLREWAANDVAEIGAHLHPWNNPPLDVSEPQDYTMLRSYEPHIQLAKLKLLTEAIEVSVGVRPKTFRAGRFALGASTLSALLDCGYVTDSSVSPYYDWTSHGNGVNWIGAPLAPYYLRVAEDPKCPASSGPFVEVPVSAGFTRFGASHWPLIASLLSQRFARLALIPSLAARSGIVRRSIMSPESSPLSDMKRVARQLVDAGIPHIHMFLHSSSLVPGLTPFNASKSDVQRMLDRIDRFVDFLRVRFSIVPRTVGEFAAEFRSKGAALEASESVKVDNVGS